MSDDAGRFRFERLNPGRYSLTASLRGQSSSPLDVALADGRREPGREPVAGRGGDDPGPGLRSVGSGPRRSVRERERAGVVFRLHPHRCRRDLRAGGRPSRHDQPQRAHRGLHDRVPHGHQPCDDRRGPDRGRGRDRLRGGLPRGRAGDACRPSGDRRRRLGFSGERRPKRHRPHRRDRRVQPRGPGRGNLHLYGVPDVRRRGGAHPSPGPDHGRHHGRPRGAGRAPRGDGGGGGVGPAVVRGLGGGRRPGAGGLRPSHDGR